MLIFRGCPDGDSFHSFRKNLPAWIYHRCTYAGGPYVNADEVTHSSCCEVNPVVIEPRECILIDTKSSTRWSNGHLYSSLPSFPSSQFSFSQNSPTYSFFPSSIQRCIWVMYVREIQFSWLDLLLTKEIKWPRTGQVEMLFFGWHQFSSRCCCCCYCYQ